VEVAQTYDWHISLYISIPLIFAVTVALSLLSYYYFEKPANRLVKRILNK
jgi:peptidoglycan/LPS O-acetylase OafA/YrhL